MLRAQAGLVQRVRLSVFDAEGLTVGLASVPTVTITRESTGATVVTGQSAEADGEGVYAYDLLPSNSTSLVDNLTLTWSYTHDGVAQTQTDEVAVVSHRLCSPLAINDSLGRGGEPSAYEARRKDLALAFAEQAFETATEGAFCVRYRRLVLDGSSSCELRLPDYRITSVRTATIDDVDVLSEVTAYEEGYLYRSSGWGWGRKSVDVGYTFGWRTPPVEVSRAVSLLASSILADGPWDDRGFGITTDGGFVRLLTAGVSGAAFSIPDVEAAVQRHRRRHII